MFSGSMVYWLVRLMRKWNGMEPRESSNDETLDLLGPGGSGWFKILRSGDVKLSHLEVLENPIYIYIGVIL